jgi:NAD(P)H dehydrogenase (quinone)
MKIFIVHAHPEPRSFVSAMRDAAVDELGAGGHEVRVSDLYAMRFQPVLDRHDFTTTMDPGYLKPQREQLHAVKEGGLSPEIEAEVEKLFWCDAVLFTFPLWWFSMPAILKGWVDRVFVMGRVYGGGKGIYETGPLRGRRGMLALATGGPQPVFSPGGRNGAMGPLLYPIQHGVLSFVGLEVLPPFVAYGAAHVTQEERAATLRSFRERMRTLETTAAIGFDLPGF